MDFSRNRSYDFNDVLLVDVCDSKPLDALDSRVFGSHKLSYDTVTSLEDVARRLHELWAIHVWRRERSYDQEYDIIKPWPCYEAKYYCKDWKEVDLDGSWSLEDFRGVVHRVDMHPVEVDVLLSEEDGGGQGRVSFIDFLSLVEHDSYVAMATRLHKLWGKHTGSKVAPGTLISRVVDSWPGHRVRMMSRDDEEEINEAAVDFEDCVLKLDRISINRREDYKSHLRPDPAPLGYPIDDPQSDGFLLINALDSRAKGLYELSYDTFTSLEDVACRLHQLWAHHFWKHLRSFGQEYNITAPWPCYEANYYSKDQKKVYVDDGWSLKDFRGRVRLVDMSLVEVHVHVLKEEEQEGGPPALVGQFFLTDHDSYVAMATWLHRLWGRHTGNVISPGTWISRIADSWPGYRVRMMSRDNEEIDEATVDFQDCLLNLDGISII